METSRIKGEYKFDCVMKVINFNEIIQVSTIILKSGKLIKAKSSSKIFMLDEKANNDNKPSYENQVFRTSTRTLEPPF